METAALWKALEKQHKTQSLQKRLRFSTASHSSHRPGGYGHTKNQEIRVGSVLCWRHSKAPSAWAPRLSLSQGLQQGFAGLVFPKKGGCSDQVAH